MPSAVTSSSTSAAAAAAVSAEKEPVTTTNDHLQAQQGQGISGQGLPQDQEGCTPSERHFYSGNVAEQHQHVPEDQASRAGTSSLDHWDAQSVDVHKSAFPVYEEDDDRGLSRMFRISIILGSVLMMVAVVLCLVVILPRSSRAAHGDNSSKLAGTLDSLQPQQGQQMKQGQQQDIAMACQGTSFPDVCTASLTSDTAARAAQSVEALVQAAIAVASRQNVAIHASAAELQRAAGAGTNPNLTAAANDCEYLLNRGTALFTRGLGSSSLQAPQDADDTQAWLSAALTYENDCRSALSYVNTTQQVDTLMEQVSLAITLTSNALSLLDAYRTYGSDTSSWRPPTRLTVYGTKAPSKAPDPASEKGDAWWRHPSVTVAQDGSGQFASVQAAVDAAPEGLTERWFVIHVRRGVYRETVRIPASKTRLALVGDGMGETVITGNRNAQTPGVTTYNSATVAVDGDHFVAVDLTFENTAGPQKHQAVALRVDSDFSVFYHCSFLGFQDTLYAHSLRQFYRGCRIEGTIDFVFGNSAALFQDCTILFRPGNPNVGTSVVSAQGRTDPAQITGLVFQNCTINGTDLYWAIGLSKHHGYLGRPWKGYSRTVFLQSTLAVVIRPEGWLPWNGSFALGTLFYAEYQDNPPVASDARVPWATQISRDYALFFTAAPFIHGDRWLPATGVPFSISLS